MSNPCFEEDVVGSVADAITTNCLKTSSLLPNRDHADYPQHLQWALPVLHVPFFSNTFIVGYIYAKAINKIVSDLQRTGSLKKLPTSSVIVDQEWGSDSIVLDAKHRFNIFFVDGISEKTSTAHLGSNVKFSNCFWYKHTALYAESADLFEWKKPPSTIVTDIPAEAKKLLDWLRKVFKEKHQLELQTKIVAIGRRPLGSVLDDAQLGEQARVFLFGSPQTELFEAENNERSARKRARKGFEEFSSSELPESLRLPVITKLCIHYKYTADESAAQSLLDCLSSVIGKCVAATRATDANFTHGKRFFRNLVEQYNRVARSVAGRVVVEKTSQSAVDDSADIYSNSIYVHLGSINGTGD